MFKSRLHVLLASALAAQGRGWESVVEGSIAIQPRNAPGPDIVVTSAPDDKGLIPLDTIKLVIEVSDATLAFDTGRKLAVYARPGIPEHWGVDVDARTIRQMGSRTAYASRSRETFR